MARKSLMLHKPLMVAPRKKSRSKSKYMTDEERVIYAMSYGISIEDIRIAMDLARVAVKPNYADPQKSVSNTSEEENV